MGLLEWAVPELPFPAVTSPSFSLAQENCCDEFAFLSVALLHDTSASLALSFCAGKCFRSLGLAQGLDLVSAPVGKSSDFTAQCMEQI